MERRTALVAAIATGVSLTAGVVAFAATGGASILGLGGGAARSGRAVDPLVVHQVQTIDDEIMVSTRTTDVPRPVARSGQPTPAAASNLAPTAVDGITVSIGPTTAAAPIVAAPVGAGATSPAELEVPAPPPATGSGDGPSGGSTTPAASPAPSSSVNATPVSANPAPTAPAGTAPASTAPATTAPATAPATTAPTSTTAARPPGVPADWPADQPIPPMPADCQQPQLEDNGVWNCDH